MIVWLKVLILLLPVLTIIYQQTVSMGPFSLLFLLLGVLYAFGFFVLPRAARDMPSISLQTIGISVCAATLTYWLSVTIGYGPFVGSAIVGLLAARFLSTENAVIAYAAAFVGMSSYQTMPSIWLIALAGVVMGAAFDVTRDMFGGIGGKLGTLAAFAVIVTKLIVP